MAIIKLTASKKAVQFVTDDGDVYQCAKSIVAMLLEEKVRGGLVVLSRLPFKVNPERFKKSLVYDPSKGSDPPAKVDLNASNAVTEASVPNSASAEVAVPDGVAAVYKENIGTSLSNDAYSDTVRKKVQEVKNFEDKIVW